MDDLYQHLIDASARKSYDPMRDIDWNEAPIDDALPYLPASITPLYGTDFYDALTPRERNRLSLHVFAGSMHAGIEFEIVLQHILLRAISGADPKATWMRYTLVELADESRHSLMFAEFIRRSGVPVHRMPRRNRARAWAIGHLIPAHLGYIGVLVAEGVLDAFQREVMADPDVHPIARRVCRIHVTEEARHLAYAEEELRRRFAALSRPARRLAGAFGAQLAREIEASIIRPAIFEDLWPGRGRELAELARHSGEGRRVIRKAAERAVETLAEVGAIDRWTRRLWAPMLA
jgi:hypothetical protein